MRLQPQQHRQALGSGLVVVYDQNAAFECGSDGLLLSLLHFSAFAVLVSGKAGERMTNLPLLPGPTLWAMTVPPCISTPLRTRKSPMRAPGGPGHPLAQHKRFKDAGNNFAGIGLQYVVPHYGILSIARQNST